MFRPVRLQGPADSLIPLDEAKLYCRIFHDDDDTTLQALIDAAEAHVDGYSGILGRCLQSQTWRQDFTDWRKCLQLPFPDVSEVSLTYVDPTGTSQAVAASVFDLMELAIGSAVMFRPDFDRPGLSAEVSAPISVEFTAGYGSAEDVPQDIRQALLLLVSHWFDNRTAVSTGASPREMPLAFQALIGKYRRIGL